MRPREQRKIPVSHGRKNSYEGARMEVIKAKFDDTKGIPPSGLVSWHPPAGAIHK
jgi:hypothetical protein